MISYVRRLSILVSKSGTNLMITKGAFPNILEICSIAEAEPGKTVGISEFKEQIEHKFEEFSEKGFRTLGVAYREMGHAGNYQKRTGNRDDFSWVPLLF